MHRSERLVGQFCWSTLPELTEEMITEIFGQEVSMHVEGLTRIKPYGKISAEESINLLIKQKRYNTVLIKLFDRIHNIQTLGAKSPEKARKIIEETLISFVTLSMYLGLHKAEEKLSVLCFKYLGIKNPYKYREFYFNYQFQPLTLAYKNDLVQSNIQ